MAKEYQVKFCQKLYPGVVESGEGAVLKIVSVKPVQATPVRDEVVSPSLTPDASLSGAGAEPPSEKQDEKQTGQSIQAEYDARTS